MHVPVCVARMIYFTFQNILTTYDFCYTFNTFGRHFTISPHSFLTWLLLYSHALHSVVTQYTRMCHKENQNKNNMIYWLVTSIEVHICVTLIAFIGILMKLIISDRCCLPLFIKYVHNHMNILRFLPNSSYVKVDCNMVFSSFFLTNKLTIFLIKKRRNDKRTNLMKWLQEVLRWDDNNFVVCLKMNCK